MKKLMLSAVAALALAISAAEDFLPSGKVVLGANDWASRADPTRPVIGVDGLELTEDRPWNTSVVASVSDYLATHPYGMWGPAYIDDFTGIRSAFFCASLTRARSGRTAGWSSGPTPASC